MNRLIVATLGVLCAAHVVLAQGRGGRRGGPGGPAVMLCLNPNIPVATQVTKGQSTADQFGVDPNNGVIVMRPSGDASQVIQPCSNFAAPDDPFARFLFPPDLVMAHQQAINLSDAQRNTIRDAVVYAQTAMTMAQFKTAGEVEKLQSMLQASTVDEAKLLEQVDRVLALEREVKRTQLTLMIRIKNALTPQQQEALARLRAGG